MISSNLQRDSTHLIIIARSVTVHIKSLLNITVNHCARFVVKQIALRMEPSDVMNVPGSVVQKYATGLISQKAFVIR